MTNESMQIRIGGDNDIDLKTLSDTLSSTINVLTTIQNKSLSEHDYCRFVVKNIDKGSFIIDIEQVLQMGLSLWPQATSILDTFKTVLDIRKHLKGEKPLSVERTGSNVIIYNTGGGNIQVNQFDYSLYKDNPQIEKECSNLFKAIEADGTRDFIEYNFGSEEKDGLNIIKFEKEEFQNQGKIIDVSSIENEIKEDIAETVVKVVKPDLQNRTKWDVIFAGDLIKVDVEDYMFLEKVHDRTISFVANMEMKVEIRARYLVDNNGMPVQSGKKNCVITKVIECGSYHI